MEAKELRAGNYVQYEDDGSIFKVTSIERYGLGVENEIESVLFIVYDKFEPIPITKEWMLKFGFKYSDDKYTHSLFNKKWNKYFKVEFCGNGLFISFSARIKYIHQLQNLYFALTGEELTTPI